MLRRKMLSSAALAGTLILASQASCLKPQIRAENGPSNLDSRKAARAITSLEPASQTQVPRRVLVIGLDGTTGNQLHEMVWNKNRAPVLRSLMEAGQYAPCPKDTSEQCARAHSGPIVNMDYSWETGPGWASVVTGVDSLRHGVKRNGHAGLKEFAERTKSHPTFLKLARDRGLETAAGGVASFVSSFESGDTKPGVLDYECGVGQDGPVVSAGASESCNATYRFNGDGKDDARDQKLAAWMLEKIQDGRAGVIMGVFDRIDSAGHSHGFDGNDEYLRAIEETDRLIEPLLSEIQRRPEDWLVLVTADHGGHRFFFWGMHGSYQFEDDAVPFLVAAFGPGMQGSALRPLTYPVRHMDVHPTVLHWLSLPIPAGLDGVPQAVPSSSRR